MTIPVYINTFNRLTTTKKLAKQISLLGDVSVIIVDNNSTWPPLVEWLKTCEYDKILLNKNEGHHASFDCVQKNIVEFNKRWGQNFYIVTDCDLDIGDCPSDMLDIIREPLLWEHQKIIKSGLSLKIDDLPDWQTEVVKWESNWWKTKIGQYFLAPIDTTFAMYNIKDYHLCKKVIGVKAVRSAPPYCARHIPWYLDCENLDEENKYYFDTANSSNSWKPNDKKLSSRFSK